MVFALWSAVSRRFALVGAVALSGSLLGACAVPPAEGAGVDLVYVGMHGPQIRAMRFDTRTGALAMIGPVAEVPRPTWAVAHPELPLLYAVNEDSAKEGAVIAFAVDRDSGALTKVNELGAGGPGTTYLWLDAPSKSVLAANFNAGSVSSLSLKADGSLGALVSTVKATGSGPHRRQTGARAHAVTVDPSGRYALVPDMGADRVFVYGFDRTTHGLSSDNSTASRSFTAAPGSGPRHVAFGAGGRFVYLANELSAEITTLRWDAASGRLSLVQTLPTASPTFTGQKSASEVAVGRDGRFVYISNRSENALLVYRVNPDSGELTLVQRTACGGDTPWGFAIHPSGQWLLVANQKSNKVNVFRIDALSGMVSDTGQSVETPTPVSITFMNAGAAPARRPAPRSVDITE